MMNSKYTRFRAYKIPDGSCFSYTVDKEFCLVGGRYPMPIVSSIAEEMRIAGCDSIDLLHIPSWNARVCNGVELKRLLEALRPTEIEIPAYTPDDENGKESLRVINEYIESSSISELVVCTPEMIGGDIHSSATRKMLTPLNNVPEKEDNDVTLWMGKGRFTVLSTGFTQSKDIALTVAQYSFLDNLDILVLQGINGNPFARYDFITAVNAKIIIDLGDNNNYYRRADVVLEKYGISTLRTEKGEIIITSGEIVNDEEIETPTPAPSIGSNYRSEDAEQYSMSEQIQEYVWTHPIDDLDPLAHHYEVDDISDIEIEMTVVDSDTLEIKMMFTIGTHLYVDNEDEKGFRMEFPAECTAKFNKEGDKFVLDDDSVVVRVDTDEYYK